MIKLFVALTLLNILINQKISFSQHIKIENGTSIISYIYKDTIWVGADSKLYNSKGLITLPVCKIYKYENFVFAHAGIYSSDGIDTKGNKYSYNFQNKFKEIVNNSSSLKEIATKLDEHIMEAENFLATNQLYYRNYSEGDTLKDLGMETLFAYFDNGIPTINMVAYLVIIKKNNKFVITRVPLNASIKPDAPQEQSLFIGFMGEKQEAIEFASNSVNQSLIIGLHPKNIIKLLMTTEIITHPEKVGEPIDIIRLTKNEIEWIDCKENCR